MSLLSRWRRLSPWLRTLMVAVVWAGSLALALLAGAYAHKYRARIRAMLRSVQSAEVIYTNLYHVGVRKLRVPTGGRDGSIAPLGDGLLLVSRHGDFWYVDSARTLAPLAVQVPINVDGFTSDPSNVDVVSADRFAVKDLVVQTMGERVRLLASFNYWYPEDDCYTLRVASAETARATLLAGGDDVTWETVFETTPCYPLSTLPGGGSPHPTLGAGGRIAALSDREILVTVGGFKGEADVDGPEYYWDPENSYGKTVLVDLEAGTSRIYTIGHRNPQGLTLARDGTVWLTEHAARGGDELNRLIDGANYGYPLVSYGTQYEQMVWSTNPQQGRHEAFAKPSFAWVPSIGISEVIEVSGDAFPSWRGDLLVASLAGETLHRVRIEGDRAGYVEPMMIDHRIRDLAELADGTVVLKTDDDFLVFLAPVGLGGPADADLEPDARGELLAGQCRSCHTFASDGPNGIGPNLWGVLGRPIADRDGFAYSDALRRLDGRWTEERLRRFLADPSGFVPGTIMVMSTSYDEEQISDLLAYLATLR